MPPRSQYQARRLLELVSANKTRPRRAEHIDEDVWARVDPPLQGCVYPTREHARQRLRAGELGAEQAGAQPPVARDAPTAPAQAAAPLPPTPPLREDVDTGALAAAARPPGALPRAESGGSRMSKISSVPSFGKMPEPLSGDSARLSTAHGPSGLPERRPRATRAEYEEFGSEALITHVYDDLEDDYEIDAEASSRLFRDIGPSISMARGIDGIDGERGKARAVVDGRAVPDGDSEHGERAQQTADPLEFSPPPPLDSPSRDGVDISASRVPQSSPPAPPAPPPPQMHSAGNSHEGSTVPPPPSPPSPSFAHNQPAPLQNSDAPISRADNGSPVSDLTPSEGVGATGDGHSQYTYVSDSAADAPDGACVRIVTNVPGENALSPSVDERRGGERGVAEEDGRAASVGEASFTSAARAPTESSEAVSRRESSVATGSDFLSRSEYTGYSEDGRYSKEVGSNLYDGRAGKADGQVVEKLESLPEISKPEAPQVLMYTVASAGE